MALVIADRVKETTVSTGTGAVTLAGASAGYQSFSVVGNGNSTYYCIAALTGTEWEVGIGTYTAAGTSLSRDTVLASSNSGSLVNFSVGAKDVFVTPPAERSLLVQSAGTGLFAGAAAFTANGVPYANSTSTLATSSSLTFDGTNFTTPRVLFGGSTLPAAGTPSIALRTSDNTVYHQSGSANTIVMLDSAQNTMQSIGATAHIWNISNSEQMRLNSTGLGIGTSNPLAKLVVSNAGAEGLEVSPTTGIVRLTAYNRSGGGYTSLSLIGTSGITQTIGSTGIDFNSQMLLNTSGNLGIGTSSPGYKLDLLGASSVLARFKSTGNYGSVNADNGSTTGGGSFVARQNGTQYAVFGVDGAVQGNTSTDTAVFADGTGSSIKLYTNGSPTLKAILDSSGNLGLGVTPSAWNTVTPVFQIGGGASLYGYGSEVRLNTNYYYSSGDKYIGNGYAASYNQASGVHKWFTAGNNTSGAGAAITFTQAMTLDASGNLLVGITSGSYKFMVGDGTRNMTINPNSFLDAIFLGTTTAKPLVFGTNDTERARIDTSGNLLVGTTTSGAAGKNITIYDSSQPEIRLQNSTTGTGSSAGLQLAIFGSTAYLWNIANGPLVFAANNAERARIDSSGNFGLGVTPSAWLSTFKAFQIGAVGSVQAASDNSLRLSYNSYYDGAAYKRIGSGYANYFICDTDSAFTWLQAGTSTADSTITWNTSMTLNASGRLGIGTTAPLALLNVASGTNTTLSVPSGVVAQFKGSVVINSLNTGGAGDVDSLYFQKSHESGINIYNYNLGIIRSYTSNGYAGGLDFYTNKNTGGGSYASTFAVRMDENGNLGIGTTSPGAKLTISNGTINGQFNVDGSGVYIGTLNNYPLVFSINSTERGRIDSSGNFGLGTSSPGSTFEVYRNNTNGPTIGLNNGATGGRSYQFFSHSNTNDIPGGFGLYDNSSGGGYRWVVTSGGNFGIGTISPTFSTSFTATNSIVLQVGVSSSANGQIRVGGNTSSDIGLTLDYSNSGATTSTIRAQYGSTSTNAALYLDSGFIAFRTGTSFTERARIDSSGNLLVGTTSAGVIGPLTLNKSSGSGFTVQDNGTDKVYAYMNGTTVWRTETITGVTIQISSGNTNGVSLANGGTSWGSLSDERKKDIIEPITDAANKVCTLRAVIGKYKTDDKSTRRSFLIAQDVQAVLPEAVVEDQSGDLILQYTETIPLLVAAIKEQQAQIESLRKRLADAGIA